VIDLEDSGGIYANMQIGDHILTWLQTVEKGCGIRPRIYSNSNFISTYLFNSQVHAEWLLDYELIVASWGTNSPTIPQPYAPGNWAAWQYRANAPGTYYGFVNANPKKSAPPICLAVWNAEGPGTLRGALPCLIP
jgi:GH25 family lysozyme M1 (1,4-beta-N-acetylmuramidase)